MSYTVGTVANAAKQSSIEWKISLNALTRVQTQPLAEAEAVAQTQAEQTAGQDKSWTKTRNLLYK